MPVTDLHRCYTERQSQWVRCRDAFEGADAVKAKKTAYLPRLANQKEDDYEAYVRRASWYGATARTVLGLTGSVMRKPPTYEVPEVLETHLEDVTQTNISLTAFASSLIQEILTVGRGGLLLDMPEIEVPGTPRPQWVKYCAEQITNWRTEMIEGVRTTTLVVLSEEYEEFSDDPFSYDCRTQYRVLRLIEKTYVVELWRKDAKEKDWSVFSTVVPKVRGAAIPYIPFVFVNPLNLEADAIKPPLMDLVDVNFSHYLNSADLEHGRHFTALPTPYVTGMAKDKTGTLHIGSSTAWCIPQPEARVGMLEFTGQGLGAIEKGCETKERQMAVLGARMLEEQKMQTEASETHAIRRSGESSLLASIAETISVALTTVAKWHAAWVGVRQTDDLKVGINKDFFGLPLTSAEIAELVKSWQSGAISYETLYYNLEQGEVTRPGVKAEEERAQIEVEMPDLPLEDEDEDEKSSPGGSGPAGGGGSKPNGSVTPRRPAGVGA